MVESKLWIITFEYIDGGSNNIYSVGVDMDKETAELLVVNSLKGTFDKEYQNDITINDLEVGEVYWEAVPEIVDGFNINITPEEA